jgi:DNA repair photolyase
MKGRGTPENPGNRFKEIHRGMDIDLECEIDERPSVATQFFKDSSKSILSKNDSPDLGFGVSVNPYRGCEHGCIYCYARPTHEYLDLSPGLDFETKIFVKENAPELLRAALAAKNYAPEPIFFSGVTDCYQPIERKLLLTRRCLEVLADCGHPVWIVTKNFLVTRDIDVLKRLAEKNACGVSLSLTSLDAELCGRMEPRTSRPQKRLEAVRLLAEAGIPVSVNLAPIIPALNETEIPALLKAAKEAGASSAWYTCVRLPHAVKDIFQQWLHRYYPDKAERVLSNIRQMRGGKLYDADFKTRMKGEGLFAERVAKLFEIYRRRNGLDQPTAHLSTASFVPPRPPLRSATAQSDSSQLLLDFD